MGNSPFADTLIQILLGWLKWLTDIVWSLIRDGGENGIGLFQWFSKNWIALFIVMLLVGLAADWIIWMIRWRPYWIWFRKKRPVVADKPVRRAAPVMAAPQRVQPPRFVSALKNEESFFSEMEDMSESAQLFDEPAMPAYKTYAASANSEAQTETYARPLTRDIPYEPAETEDYGASASEDMYYAAEEAVETADTETATAIENEDHRRYMRPETESGNETAHAEEEARPLSRRERRKFFEEDNEEDDE